MKLLNTNTNWEGCGVTPDILAAQEQALNVAYRLALKSIIENIVKPADGLFNRLLVEAQVALDEIENL